VRIELSGYEADIYLTAENDLKVREYDHTAGRIAEGEEALQRVLIRSREPGGIINVYQTNGEPADAEETKRVEKPATVLETREKIAAPGIENKPSTVPTNGATGKAKIAASANDDGSPAKNKAFKETPKLEGKPSAPTTIFPNVPFEFSNKVEAKAKQFVLSKEDRELLLNLTAELLGTIDRALAMAQLDFSSAFQKARAEIAGDYPFLKSLDYGEGKIYCADASTNAKFFVAGILEAVRRILDKLASNAKFAEVHRFAVQRMLTLIHHRRPFYDRFSMTGPLEKILGV
jgi:hypothetical protein